MCVVVDMTFISFKSYDTKWVMIFSDKKIRIKLWPHVTFCSKIKKSTSICFCVGFKETRDLDFFVPFFFFFFCFPPSFVVGEAFP